MTRPSPRTFHDSPSDEALTLLRAEHADLEARLEQLENLRSLSPEEQYEKQVIKKRKLFLKDRIERFDGEEAARAN